MKSIFEYENYRILLEDFFKQRKSQGKYSYRDFSQAAGMNSSSWLMHLINGTKNLSSVSAQKVAKVLGLDEKEEKYFLLLVKFTQSKSSRDKDKYFRSMLDFKGTIGDKIIDRGMYDYYTAWYHPVIRSLIDKVEWGNDYALLGRMVVPPISASKARKSVKLLERLGLIVQDQNGAWKRTSAIISTGDEVRSLNIVNYHKEVSQLARDAYDRSSSEERDISALTLGVGEKEFKMIKSKIQAFRKEIIEIARNAEEPDRVYQLNFQLFPASRKKRAYRKKSENND